MIHKHKAQGTWKFMELEQATSNKNREQGTVNSKEEKG
jgi:hypothetical protein